MRTGRLMLAAAAVTGLAAAGPARAALIGNLLVARGAPTDGDGRVLQVYRTDPAPADGAVDAFRYFRQGDQTGLFEAYVLRPTGNPDEYHVLYTDGPVNVGSGTANAVNTFTPAQPVPVKQGDLIAHYGQGIPYDEGGGEDKLPVYFPVTNSLTAGQTVTLNPPDARYTRTYSFAADFRPLVVPEPGGAAVLTVVSALALGRRSRRAEAIEGFKPGASRAGVECK